MLPILLRLCWGSRLVLRRLPTPLVLRCTSSIAGIVSRFCTRDTAIIDAQLRYAFPDGDSRPQRGELLGRDIFRHVGESVGECLLWERFLSRQNQGCRPRNDTGKRKESIVDCSGDLLEDLVASNTAAIGLSGHLGSFELLAAYLAHRGLKCSVIGRAPNYPVLENIVRSLREGYGVEVIWSNSPAAPRELISAIRRGRVICALIDQDTRWKSAFSPFFGLDAACPVAPIQLALRFRLPIFTSFIVRAAPMQHQVYSQILDYQSDDPNAQHQILKTYNQRLESWVCRYPEQYIWWHRRWRRRPGVDYAVAPQLLRSSSQYREWLSGMAEHRARTPQRPSH